EAFPAVIASEDRQVLIDREHRRQGCRSEKCQEWQVQRCPAPGYGALAEPAKKQQDGQDNENDPQQKELGQDEFINDVRKEREREGESSDTQSPPCYRLGGSCEVCRGRRTTYEFVRINALPAHR